MSMENSLGSRRGKRSPAPNQIACTGTVNPVRSTYQELWDQVALAEADGAPRHPWLPNILRRILESYFSTLGPHANLYDIGAKFDAESRQMHHALVAWAHAGSHTVIDAELFIDPQFSDRQWLEAFKRVFEEYADGAHRPHYDMMLGDARQAGVLFAQPQ